MTEKKAIKTREEISEKYKWNIQAMYADEALWEQDMAEAKAMTDAFGKYKGKLAENGEILLSALKDKDAIWQKAERAYVYAHMKKDEDNRASKYQTMTDKAYSLMAYASAALSFFTPELLSMPEDRLLGFLKGTKGLNVYGHLINEILREKEHVLTEAEERILAKYSEITCATNDIFTMFNNADVKFGTIENDKGEEVEVTHGRYVGLMESSDRHVRKEAFEHMYASYQAQINTLASTYHYNTKTDTVNAGIRRYGSALEAALSGDNIREEVYDNLIAAVNEHLPLLHRYMDIRKRALNVDELHMYDIYTPLVAKPEEEVTWNQALDIMREGLAPLGEEYIREMNKGIAQGWIDVYENEGKTSGAYSFGSYDSMPYILMNFDGRLQDVFTIVHEMGHSMHSHFTREKQPYVYGSHSIFTAETASTVNENLLMKHLLKKETDPEKKKYLLNIYLEEFRGTVFRQTMFAEFERLTHKAVEEGETLTAEWLNNTYLELNKKYFGPNVVSDPQIAYEWARIPHFYSAFYVYKYATGYSAAGAISDKILEEGDTARDAYLKFLGTGESDYPIELLKIAGVDMSTREPIERALKTFGGLLDQLEGLL